MTNEQKQALKELKDKGAAFCPVCEKAYLVPFNEPHKEGKITTCKVCQKRIDREDRMWFQMIA